MLQSLPRLGLCLALLVAALTPARPAHAAGVVGNGTLASCTEAAPTAALLGGGTVTFNCGGPATILLLTEKVISQNTVIQGSGVITITGGLATRLFRVDAPASLTLNDIILDSAYSTDGLGGAVESAGTLPLNNVTIQYSQTGPLGCGGAILARGSVTISDSRFKNNTSGRGGAICAGDEGDSTRTAQITNTSFENNRANIGDSYGGAVILYYGTTLTDVGSTFTQNIAKYGGALAVMEGAAATLRSGSGDLTTHFSENSATNSGGAVYSRGALNLFGVRFSQNTVPDNTAAVGYGGGVASLGTLSLNDSRFELNRGRFGGGLFVGGNAGTSRAQVQGTIFSYNTAGVLGGGLYTNFNAAVITVTNSTFFGNVAVGSGGGLARSDGQLQISNSSFRQNTASTGGGLYVGPGSTYVQARSVTFSANEAVNNRGGGVYNEGRVELYFTTLVSNTNGVYSTLGGNTRFRNAALHNPGSLNCDGDGTAQISNDAANHVSDNSCGLQFTNLGDPQLGPSQTGSNNTSFHLPLAGSPLIHTGYSNCPERDQRGALRPDACDIGAAEFGGLLPVVYLPLLTR
jgi:predicted outer membrane repeat protein